MAASLQELTAAWVAVATVTLSEYRRQCWHLAGLACSEVVERADGAVTLWEIAVARVQPPPTSASRLLCSIRR